MFLLDTLLLLSPLAVYACIRVRQQMDGIVKRVWTLVSVAVALGYPVAERLSHSSAGQWAKPAMIVGYCSLPFALYLVLTVLACDLIFGVLRLAKVVSRDTLGKQGLRRFRLAFWLVVPLIVVFVGLVNHQRLQVSEYAIDVPRKSSRIRQLRILFIADIHLTAITAGDLMERLVSRINAANPDIVLIGGDVLEGDRPDEDTSGYEAHFRQIRPKHGVYGAPGNHDRRIAQRTRFFEKAGIRLLADAVQPIDHAFYVAGRSDSRSAGRKPVEELLRSATEDLPVILIAHRPVDFENVSRSKVDIHLSGHTHNGQVFPVNFVTGYQNELSWGYLKKRQTHFFVTSGVQLWGPPVRTAGVSEIMLINVSFR
ncbi:MAG: metallophosphoesterase [Acidobacteriota bacterium]